MKPFKGAKAPSSVISRSHKFFFIEIPKHFNIKKNFKNNKMQYFCILLKSDEKRKNHVIKHLLKNIPSLNIVSAIDAKTNELEYYLGNKEILPNFYQFARRGQLACLLSHIKVWKQIVERKIEYSVVLEDDAIISEKFDFKDMKNLKYDLIYLFVHPDSKSKSTPEKFSEVLDKGYPTFGTVGYCISYQLAKELIAFFSEKISTTVDDSISWYLTNHNKNYYCVRENVVETAGQLYFHREDNSNLGSTISEAGLFKDSINNKNINFSFYLEEEDYLVYPCCNTKDGNIRLDEKTDKEKYLSEENVVAFCSDGWVKNRLTKNFKLSKSSLYVKKRKGNETIFITGGLGFIGSNTIYEIINLNYELNYEIVIIDNLSNSYIETLEKLYLFDTNKRIHFYQGDVQNAVLLNKIFKYHNIVSVIHFAAYKAVAESVENPLKYYENNIGGLITLLKTMQTLAVKNLIFSSSATVYGNPESLPLTEESKTSTLNPYGRTKLFAEEILRDMKDMKIICLRYFNPVGASCIFNEVARGVPNNLFPYIISVIKGERDMLKIYGGDYETKDGTPVRDYIHVSDLAKGHIASLNYLDKMSTNFEVFNLGTGNGFTVLEVIHKFQDLLGKEIPYQIVERRSGDSPAVYADCTKAKTLLNWETHLTLDDMIRDSLKFV
jgi:UDP-glucose 4-epimerase